MGVLVVCIQELSIQLLCLKFSFTPLLDFFQCNSAREHLSGGGLSSVTNLKDFLVLIRADIFQDHVALTLGLILCECSTATSIFYF